MWPGSLTNSEKTEKGAFTMKNVMIVTGAGQISMAIARRIGFGMKIVLGDKKK